MIMKRAVIGFIVLAIVYCNSFEGKLYGQERNDILITGRIEEISISLVVNFSSSLFIKLKNDTKFIIISIKDAYRYGLVETPNLSVKSLEDLDRQEKYLTRWKGREVTLNCSIKMFSGIFPSSRTMNKPFYIVNSLKWGKSSKLNKEKYVIQQDTSSLVEPLHVAVENGDVNQIKRLIAQGVNINAKTKKYGFTPLHTAAFNKQKTVVELLIAKGANINEKSSFFGTTSLHSAAAAGDKAIAEMLINKGANLEAKDKYGVTPLHIASHDGHKAVVELLISKGADVNAKAKNDVTPLHFAVMKGHSDIAELLRQHGAKD